jgi:UDP-N-acetylmuramoylalanine--D-glutamate ligase
LELLLEIDRENVIAITGTKGKSTTTTLLYEVIKNQKENTFLLLNI